MDGHSTNKKFLVVILGSLFVLCLGCVVTFAFYPGYRIMHWLLIGPGPAKPGVWIATRESQSFINRVPEVNSETNDNAGLLLSLEFPEPQSLPVMQGNDPILVVNGAKPSNPAVIPLQWDGQCFSYSQTGESIQKSLDDQFVIIRLPLFKEKYAIIPKTELQPGAYAVSLQVPAEPWDIEGGPAYYLFEVQ